jgi:phenylalanyl-tRNA synthetase beta chain
MERIDGRDVEAILTRLGFVLANTEDGWTVGSPAFRHDVTREIDLVEEFIRVYGMDKIRTELPTFRPVVSPVEKLSFDTLRTAMCAMGYTEVITYSFISPRWNRFFGDKALELLNPISDEMKAMRPSLIPGLATVAARNKSLQRRDMSLFEIGKCFLPMEKGGLPHEQVRLGAVLTGQREETHWSGRARDVDFYDMKGLAEALLPDITVRPSEHAFYKPGHQADILLDERTAGHLGALSDDILAMLDITDEVYALEVDADAVLKKTFRGVQEIPRFPMTWRDLSLVADEGVAYSDIVRTIEGLRIRELRLITAVDLYTGEKLVPGKKGITIRLTYQSETRTLEDSIINKWQDKVIQSLSAELGIQLRQ